MATLALTSLAAMSRGRRAPASLGACESSCEAPHRRAGRVDTQSSQRRGSSFLPSCLCMSRSRSLVFDVLLDVRDAFRPQILKVQFVSL